MSCPIFLTAFVLSVVALCTGCDDDESLDCGFGAVDGLIVYLDEPDGCRGWFFHASDPVLVTDSIRGLSNLDQQYQMDSLPVQIEFEQLDEEAPCGFSRGVPFVRVTCVEEIRP